MKRRWILKDAEGHPLADLLATSRSSAQWRIRTTCHPWLPGWQIEEPTTPEKVELVRRALSDAPLPARIRWWVKSVDLSAHFSGE